MKKIMIALLVIIVVFFSSVFAGKMLYENYEKNEVLRKETEIMDNEINQNESTHIIERGEMNTMSLFELEPGISNYEVDLTANDMIWNSGTSLYHKIITNTEEYNKYKERINLPEMTDTDFKDSFLVILVNENVRSHNEVDLMVYAVVADETTTHIIMKQKENPNYYSENNVFYAIVDISELKENILVEIQ